MSDVARFDQIVHEINQFDQLQNYAISFFSSLKVNQVKQLNRVSLNICVI